MADSPFAPTAGLIDAARVELAAAKVLVKKSYPADSEQQLNDGLGKAFSYLNLSGGICRSAELAELYPKFR